MNERTSMVGLGLPRLEAEGKINGRSQYTDDLIRPRMLHGAILGSAYAHARIKSYDVSKARALPGVQAVLTGEDFERLPMGPVIKDETVLAKGKVRYIGEPVAAVAAANRQIARAALALIEIEYEELPAVLTAEAALADGAPTVHEELDSYIKIFDARFGGNVMSRQEIVEGEVEAAWDRCDVVVEGVYETQAQAHAYLEPCSALAEVDERGKLTIWSSHQSINRVQANVAEGLGLPMSRIRVITPRVGGGFGGKMEATVQPIAAALALRTGRPVKVTLSREDDFMMIRSRHPTRIYMKTGVRKDGTLVAREAELLYDGGAYADDSPAVLGFGLLMARGPYRIEHVRSVGRVVYTNKLRAAGFRGFGNPQVTFAGESQMDEIAERLGMDPIELRLKNAMRKGDRWVGGHSPKSCGLVECIEKVRNASEWGGPLGPATRDGKVRGRGIACLAHICGVLGTSAVVRLAEDGSIVLATGAVDIGQGADTVLAQICAETLGLDVSRVNVVAPDTDSSPYNWGTAASRVTYMAGRAVAGAAQRVKDKIFEHVAEMLECAIPDLELRPGGRVGVKGIAQKEVTFFDVSMRSLFGVGGPIIATESLVYDGEPFDPKRTVMLGYPFANLGVYLFGAQIVEVEIDTDTGQVEVVKAWLAHDVGRAINPTAVEGQIQGGFAQGVGYALAEELVWEDGRLANPSLMDYKIPGPLDVPYEITSIIVEDPEPTGPFGAKGIGEPGILGVAPAVANAVANATGVRLRRIPLTSERVFRALNGEQADRE